MLKSKFLLVLLFSISAVYICKGVNAKINKEISAIAKNINVKILGPSGNGSGVIIKSDLNEYLVLTAWHVIKDLNEKDDLDIKTYDGVLHNYSKGSIYKIKNVDLGVLMFESFNEYKVAEIGKVGNSKWEIKFMFSVSHYQALLSKRAYLVFNLDKLLQIQKTIIKMDISSFIQIEHYQV